MSGDSLLCWMRDVTLGGRPREIGTLLCLNIGKMVWLLQLVAEPANVGQTLQAGGGGHQHVAGTEWACDVTRGPVGRSPK